MSTTYERIRDEARDLASEDGENVEYDRALVELVTRLLGLTHNNDGHLVARVILSPDSPLNNRSAHP